jgi:phenylacetate-CoA ligase
MRTFLAEPGDEICHLPMTLPVGEVISGLNAAQPELLMGYPSAIDRVVREAQAGRLKIAPRYVETGGELLMERTRVAVRELWGAEIDDSWAVAEGVYAFSCPSSRSSMHLPDDLVIIEPVDRNGRPVPFGEPAAKLYLTNLYNRTQPLIRFEIADGLTVVDEPCPCGSAHRRITDLTGRADIVFAYENGVTVEPMTLRLELHDERYVTEYQVRQTTQGLWVKVVTDRPENSPLSETGWCGRCGPPASRTRRSPLKRWIVLSGSPLGSSGSSSRDSAPRRTVRYESIKRVSSAFPR